MKIGRVMQRLQPMHTVYPLEGQNLLLVRCGQEELAAVDKAGARIGDQVLVYTGRAAFFGSQQTPADAVIAAVVKETD